MGIRFFCPNGHKLNVKEHLAGKTGFCPECGVRLAIPYQSTRKSSRELHQEKVGNESPPDVPTPGPTPAAFFPEETPQQNAAENDQIYTTEAVPNPFPGVAPTATEPSIINPILQDQTVVWYVQSPGGEPYGPATGEVINTWIQERRIGPTMLVWREGWNNWMEANKVFPELE